MNQDSSPYLPLSFRQRQVVEREQAVDGIAKQCAVVRCSADGDFDLTAFRRAVDLLVERHEPLRTFVRRIDGDIVQVVRADAEFPVTAARHEVTTDELIRLAVGEPMSFDTGPLARAAVTLRGAGGHEIVFALHSLVADQWSLDLFLREFSTAYRALRTGGDPVLPELDIQFLDWVDWRAQLPPDRMAELSEWWTRTLATATVGLRACTGSGGPQFRRTRSALDPATTRAVDDLRRREGVSGFVLFAAVFAAALGQHGYRGDVAVLVPVANRDHTQVRDALGPFAEFAPMVLSLDGSTLRELFSRVRTAVAAMHAHRELSVEQRVVESISAGHVPIRFTHRTRGRSSKDRDETAVILEPIEFDFLFVAVESESGYEIGADHDASLVPEDDVRELAATCAAILRTAATAPGGKAVEPATSVRRSDVVTAHGGNGNRYGLPADLVALTQEFGRFLRANVIGASAVGSEVGRVRRLAGEIGFLAPRFRVEDGGRGTGVLGTALMVEQAAATGSPLAHHAVGPPAPTTPSPALVEMSSVLRTHYLADLLGGRTTLCVAITERAGGSDLSSVTTRAVREGNDWLLSGEKTYISNADDAHLALVVARTGDTGAVHADLTAFLVQRDDYRVTERQDMIGDFTTHTVVFDNARVTADHIVSTVGNGMEVAVSILDENRIYIAAQALGMAEWCFGQAVDHVRRRTAYGRPLSDLQGVSFGLVDCSVGLDAIRALTYETARRADRDGVVSMRDCSSLKLMATEKAFAIADRCVQLMGARGLDRDAGLEAVLRYLRMLRVVEGSSELQRSVIGQLMGLGAGIPGR